MRNVFPPLEVCSAHGEYGRKKCKRIPPVPESSLPPHRDSHNSRPRGRMDQAKKKKKSDATSKRGLLVKKTGAFFCLSRFQAQTLNVAWSGPGYEFIASVSMVI